MKRIFLKIGSNLFRGKTRLVLFTMLLTLIVISIFAAITLYAQKSHEIASTSFMCLSESTNQTFTTTAEVNLADGMDETEVITLASKVFDHALAIDADYIPNYVLQSESVPNANQTVNTWVITMERIYTTTQSLRGFQYEYKDIILHMSWTLQTTINPTIQTIQYTTQMQTSEQP